MRRYLRCASACWRAATGRTWPPRRPRGRWGRARARSAARARARCCAASNSSAAWSPRARPSRPLRRASAPPPTFTPTPPGRLCCGKCMQLVNVSVLNLVHLRSFSGLNAWRGNGRPQMLWSGCRPGGWCARESTRRGQTSASASTRPGPRRTCSWPRPTTLRSSREVCATACWWGALADECPACHKLCRVADERFSCRLCHAWTCPCHWSADESCSTKLHA